MIGKKRTEKRSIQRIFKYHQEHILHFWDELSEQEQKHLLEIAGAINFRKIQKYYKIAKTENKPINFSLLEPSDYVKQNDERREKFYQLGSEALKSGKVAFLTVAGGQASRLGFDLPKGCFGISPITQKSLFQIFAEKILFYSNLYNQPLKWFIMTSIDNFKTTVDFFSQNNYFNLDKKNVFFFKQGINPTVTSESGDLILKNKSELFMNPNGHGGILGALTSQGYISQMEHLGIEYLSYFQVDNPLINMADPYFIGCHIDENSNISTKVIRKEFAEEKLGIAMQECKSTKRKIVEYSDIPEKIMKQQDENGNLLFNMGSTGIHIFSVSFIKKASSKLPIHIANKEMTLPNISNSDNPEKKISVLKFETFVFDTIPLAKKAIFFETSRNEEFFPLKNKTGTDSIETCIDGQINLYRSWLKDLGCKDIDKIERCEISPLFAPDRASFLEIANKKLSGIKEMIYENNNIKKEIYIH
ncbi:MAG: UTP--glucose-1-phosphate uridylyltransferase [Spirochaetales bacterium]|nr:UTP--glucose-1-phosphate uridylyltransferase [Spirochaetales bacterium]